MLNLPKTLLEAKGARVKVESIPAGAPCWVDLHTPSAEVTRNFYGKLLGWEFDPPAAEFGGYFNFRKDGEFVAGCMPQAPDSDTPPMLMTYFSVLDARNTIAAATAHRGSTLVPAMEVGDLGTMAVLADSGGAAVGLWEPKLHGGFGRSEEAGVALWFELEARQYQSSVEFYRDVFGVIPTTMSETANFGYTTLNVAGVPRAGIVDASSSSTLDAPPSWLVYFGVEDTDRGLEVIAENGGSIISPAMDSPFGRLATVADPHGARFRILSRP